MNLFFRRVTRHKFTNNLGHDGGGWHFVPEIPVEQKEIIDTIVLVRM